MSKSTLLRIGDLSRSSELPPDTRLVLDFGREPYAAAKVERWREQRLEIVMLVATARTLGDRVITSFVDQNIPALVVVEEPPSMRDALALARGLSRAHLTFELPLQTDDHLDVFKVLSSLGVQTRVPFRVFATANDQVQDALYDAVLRPGRRAPMVPFWQIEQHFLDDAFELEQLDYRDNDYFVDLRESTAPRPRTAWDDVRPDQKRVPFLLELKPCAYCEGLLFCHGYLGRGAASLDPCRAMLSEFIELHNSTFRRQGGQGRGGQRPNGPQAGPPAMQPPPPPRRAGRPDSNQRSRG